MQFNAIAYVVRRLWSFKKSAIVIDIGKLLLVSGSPRIIALRHLGNAGDLRGLVLEILRLYTMTIYQPI